MSQQVEKEERTETRNEGLIEEKERIVKRRKRSEEGMKEARMEGTSCAACLTLAKMIFLGSLSVSHIISDENEIMCTMAFSPPAPIRI